MTRKLVALAMLSVLIFNMGGYFILYRILERQAAAILDERIDAGDIAAKEMVEFRVTFELPYPVHEQQLESRNRVVADGVPFSITNNEYKDYKLTLVGVRDQWAEHVNAVMDAYNKTANGESDTDNGIIHSLNNFLMGFEDSTIDLRISSMAWAMTLGYGPGIDRLSSIDLPVAAKPPMA